MTTEGVYIQYPDLTEITVGYCGLDRAKFRYSDWYFDASCMYNPDDVVKTRFAFAVSSPRNSKGCIETLLECGYKPLACANNWHRAHRGDERKMTFYWKEYPQFIEPLQGPHHVQRYSNCGWERCEGFLSGSGCGFSLSDRLPYKRLFEPKFFALLRLEKVKGIEKAWLKRNNFRQIAEGSFGVTYWLNGWKPEEFSFELENEFWRKREANIKTRREAGKANLAG